MKRVFATFQYEPTNSTREILGADNLFWSSDYPHLFLAERPRGDREFVSGGSASGTAKLVGGLKTFQARCCSDDSLAPRIRETFVAREA